MLLLGLSVWWIVGWVVGAVVVAVAAALLVAIIGLGRRIARQADAITDALDGARMNTEALWEVKQANLVLDRIVGGLAAAREAMRR